MRYYELMFVLDPSNDEGAEAIKQKIEGIIGDHEGTISSFGKLGKKRLAYPIAKRQYGIYNLVNFQGNATVVAPLETFLRLDSQIFRHIVLVFSEKSLKLRTETQRIQVEEDERMRRGGRPTQESTDVDKNKDKTSNPLTTKDFEAPSEVKKVEEDIVEEVSSITTESVADKVTSDEPTTSEKDEKVAVVDGDTAVEKDDESSTKETVE